MFKTKKQIEEEIINSPEYHLDQAKIYSKRADIAGSVAMIFLGLAVICQIAQLIIILSK